MILHGDCLEVLATIPENSIDTCITDPPYELGFMGKKWDSSGIAFQPETWQAVYRVLKPGALLLAFGGTRTYHRIACAIEDAGFEIRDTIAWVYGSGFPKSYDIGKGIDKKAGAKREVVGVREDFNKRARKNGVPSSEYIMAGGWKSTTETVGILTAPSTPEAQLWHGWGTALKPAHEPIVVAMKPIDGNFVNNALTWGVAGLWIDGGRVGTEEVGARARTSSESGNTNMLGVNAQTDFRGAPNVGRFPSNFIHDGSDEVKELFPQTGGGSYSAPKARKRNNGLGLGTEDERYGSSEAPDNYGDSGSAARFFKQCKFSQEELWQLANIAEKSSSPQKSQDAFVQELAQILERHEVQLNEQALQAILDCIGSYSECIQSQSFAQCAERWANTDTIPTTQNRLKLSGYAQPATDEFTNSDKLARAEQKSEHSRFLYCPKASRSERNAGLEGMEEFDIKGAVGMPVVDNGRGDEYLSHGVKYERKTKAQNFHPTVKPLALMRYLVRLTKTPTGGIVLDPFMGSGTTGIACELEGRDFIGIEREPEYIEIAEKRIAHYRLPILEDVNANSD